jgi:hypothetical protein
MNATTSDSAAKPDPDLITRRSSLPLNENPEIVWLFIGATIAPEWHLRVGGALTTNCRALYQK